MDIFRRKKGRESMNTLSLSSTEIISLKKSINKLEDQEDDQKSREMFLNPRKTSIELASLLMIAYDSLSSLSIEKKELNDKMSEYLGQFSAMVKEASSLIDDMNISEYGGHTRKDRLLSLIGDNRHDILMMISNAQKWTGCFVSDEDEE
jgi:hypothetical protein